MAVQRDNVKVSKEEDVPVENITIATGPLRSYLKVDSSKEFVEDRSPTNPIEKGLIALLIVVGASIRFSRLDWPNTVVDNEDKIGSYISKYLKNDFFVDTNPPLPILLYTLVAKLIGFNGDFLYSTLNEPYPVNVPYVAFRFTSALLGLFSVVLFYFTLRASGVRFYVAFATALAFIFENGYITMSRFMFEDSPFIFFMALGIYLFKKSQLYSLDSCKSYACVIGSAVSLGCLVSSRWAGAFVVAWVGICIVLRFILSVGDLSKPVCSSIKHTTFKGILYLMIPSLIYILSFYLHFRFINNFTDDANIFSPEFKNSLNGSNIPSNIKAQVGLGSHVSIRHTGTYGGYLHSHDMQYKTGSEQRQITLYPYDDMNNDWMIELYTESGNPITNFTEITDGTKVRFLHASHCRLHSHDHKPPVSENSDWQKEVSCYGFHGFDGDANDDWVIEIDKDASVAGKAQDTVRAIETKFRLRHAMMGCYLFSHETRLPTSFYSQQEVTCASAGIKPLTLWYIESNNHEFLPDDVERVSYPKSTFWQKFQEYHKNMNYVADKLDIPQTYSSNPLTWSFMLRGVELSSNNYEIIYFLGNAVFWWSVTLFIGAFGIGCAYELISWQLGKPILENSYVVNFHIQTAEYLLGYAIYMVPFILIAGNYYIYQYLPAYYFGALALGHGLDSLIGLSAKKYKQIAIGLIAIFAIANIYFFQNRKYITNASLWNRDLCMQSKWLESWDYDCEGYWESVDEYKAHRSANKVKSKPATVTYGFPLQTDKNGIPKEDPVDKLLEKDKNAVFVDQDGNRLGPNEVKKLMKEGGVALNRGEVH